MNDYNIFEKYSWLLGKERYNWLDCRKCKIINGKRVICIFRRKEWGMNVLDNEERCKRFRKECMDEYKELYDRRLIDYMYVGEDVWIIV